MKTFLKVMIAIIVMLSNGVVSAQIKNSKTATVKIYGNCGMCKKTIEKAGNIQDIAFVDWNKDTKIAILTFDSTQTTQNKILKEIALAGYDSEKIKAKTEDYANLPKCCQYNRK